MASLVESGVKNLNFGDADSVGFFQMRVGIWNKGEYAGFPEKPELQAKWFLDQAEAVKKQRIAARPVGHRPEPVRRVDRRRRAPGRAVPRPLPAPPRRGEGPARVGRLGAAAAPAAAAAAAAPVPGAPGRGRCGRGAGRAEEGRVGPVHGRRRRREREQKGGSGMFLAAQPPAGPASAVAAAAAPCPAWSTPPRRRRPAPAAARSARRRSSRRRPSSACTSRAPTPARRSTSTSRPPASAPATRGARASSPGRWRRRATRWTAAAGRRCRPGSATRRPGKNDLKIISADQARPGDIVAYDWGKEADFGADGHIGFLASNVEGGKFTALEGNNQDQVMKRPARRRTWPTSSSSASAATRPAAVRRRPRAAARAWPTSRPRRRPRWRRRGRLPGRQRLEGRAREVDGRPGREARAAAPAAGHGLARRVRREEPQLRRRRLRRLLPDARRDLEQGRLRGIPGGARAAGQVVPRQRRAGQEGSASPRGKSVTDPKQFGEWIADVERPAAQYRGRYQLRLGEANGLLGSAGGAPSAPAAVEQAGAPAPAASATPARPPTPRRPPAAAGAEAPRARRRSPRWPRRRSTPAPSTTGAARRRRPASTAPASCSGPTRRRASRSRA